MNNNMCTVKRIMNNNQSQLFIGCHIINGAVMNIYCRLYGTHLKDGLFFALITMFAFFISLCTLHNVEFNKSQSRMPDFSRALASSIAWILLLYCFDTMQFTKVVAGTLTYPIFASIISILYLKEKLTIKKFTSITLGIIGGFIILYPTKEDVSFSITQILSIMSVMTAWVYFDIISKKIAYPYGPKPLTQIFFYMLFLFMLNTPKIAYITHKELTFTLSNLHIFILLGINWWIFIWTELISIQKCGELTNIIPFYSLNIVLASFSAFLFFNEIIHINTIVGSVIIIVSNTLLFKRYKTQCK